MQKWKISRSTARFGGWHIQARTDDELSSFAIVCKEAMFHRGKAADGKADVFTLTDPATGSTVNVYGKIAYSGEWPKSK